MVHTTTAIKGLIGKKFSTSRATRKYIYIQLRKSIWGIILPFYHHPTNSCPISMLQVGFSGKILEGAPCERDWKEKKVGREVSSDTGPVYDSLGQSQRKLGSSNGSSELDRGGQAPILLHRSLIGCEPLKGEQEENVHGVHHCAQKYMLDYLTCPGCYKRYTSKSLNVVLMLEKQPHLHGKKVVAIDKPADMSSVFSVQKHIWCGPINLQLMQFLPSYCYCNFLINLKKSQMILLWEE